MLSRGDRIGRYIVEDQIAIGGMAATYLCVTGDNTGFEKHVVVKMMRPEHGGESRYQEMFLDEARLCARLAHSNIPQVFEFGDHGGLPFLVMEHVDGPSFHRLLRQIQKKKLTPPAGWAVGICHDVAMALDYAGHGTDPSGQPLKTVHRDVSPANILVTQGGHAKLIDFGIAKAEARLHETEIGTLKGRIQFMSPEQLEGRTDLDSRSDIFSLGVCLFMSIAGTSPYEGQDAVQVFQNRLRGRHKDLRALRPDCPDELVGIVQMAMAQAPGDRYQRPSELAAALEALVQTRPEQAWSANRLSSWIEEVFPDGQQSWRSGGASPTQHGGSLSGATLHTPTNHSPVPTPSMSTPFPNHPTVPPTPMLVAPQASNRALLPLMLMQGVVVLLLLLLVLGGVGWMVTQGGGEEQSPEAVAASVEPAAGPALVTIESEPPGAEVFEEGGQLGATPLTIELGVASGAPPRVFELRLEGHEPLVVRQGWSESDVVRAVVLKPAVAAVEEPAPKPAPARPAPRPSPRPRPAPAAPAIKIER